MPIVEEIFNGEFDDKLDVLSNAIASRQKFLASKFASSLNAGDKVQVTNCSPKYLVGCEATVVSHKNGKVEIRMDVNHRARKYSGRIVTVSPSMIRRSNSTAIVTTVPL